MVRHLAFSLTMIAASITAQACSVKYHSGSDQLDVQLLYSSLHPFSPKVTFSINIVCVSGLQSNYFHFSFCFEGWVEGCCSEIREQHDRARMKNNRIFSHAALLS